MLVIGPGSGFLGVVSRAQVWEAARNAKGVEKNRMQAQLEENNRSSSWTNREEEGQFERARTAPIPAQKGSSAALLPSAGS